MPITTEGQYEDAMQLFAWVWELVQEQQDHPLGSLFLLLRDHIQAYEDQAYPIPEVSPDQLHQQSWPQEVLDFKGNPELEPFELHRDDLKPQEDPQL
ncbi:hypothetical protein [Deinococcus cellulosilyticus]|uniref:Uncharacterized protein n=1 Tax=Deinococcus cellulosilyticus (strain DSM 18568 / NBRC 106333 / KACC 11606 / 5516J-15) TaxID=1223518 RepID=A0A511N689_DEIC1|nr:hypothetical protein [Deinococcus cellulosilyticus]GEM48389.1 hypothetical protein DC3_40240 [Deinococcus cellulosilyticus NBRC 106333 = KACC 11606]